MEWQQILHMLGELGSFGQLGVFAALLGIMFQLRSMKDRFDALATRVEKHAETISKLEVSIARLQGWLDREELTKSEP